MVRALNDLINENDKRKNVRTYFLPVAANNIQQKLEHGTAFLHNNNNKKRRKFLSLSLSGSLIAK